MPGRLTHDENRKIALCAATHFPEWYPGKLQSVEHTDKVRGDLSLEFIREAKSRGCQVVICDGQSSSDFQKIIFNTQGINVIKRKGFKRSPGKRQTFKLAARLPGVKVIVTTEAEKVSLVTHCLDLIAKPLLENKADVVVPYRNPELFLKTYPKYISESEVEGNNLYNEYLKSHGLLSNRQNLDMFFGPKAFRNEPKVLHLFMKRFKMALGGFTVLREYFDPEETSDTTFFPIVQALKRKLRVQSVEVPFEYPSLQKENEEMGNRQLFLAKRSSQRLGLLVDLTHLLAYLEKNPGSRLKKI